jgi:hypothetical protein
VEQNQNMQKITRAVRLKALKSLKTQKPYKNKMEKRKISTAELQKLIVYTHLPHLIKLDKK